MGYEYGKYSYKNIENHKERLFLCEVCEQENEELSYELNINQEFAKSPLNYVGGKYKLLEQLTQKWRKLKILIAFLG